VSVGIRLRGSKTRKLWLILLPIAGLALAAIVYFGLLTGNSSGGRLVRLRQYWANQEARSNWAISLGERCQRAPFLQPTSGFIGIRWGDSFRPGRVHQGLDIFGPTGPRGLGETPVVAAYDGYLTRLPDWRSSVILRHPSDPLQPGRQIWTYYTHMADEDGNTFILEDYTPGTNEAFVRAGDLLGFQGNYSGDRSNPTGMHLHFSIVRDDGQGRFLNELRIENTLDPAPYLGLEEVAQPGGDSLLICPPA
jgi:murein DD-endopeptidase MepM/ murein hydrolase activator NlpD